MAAEAGKGDSIRPTNHAEYSANYDLIFRKKLPMIIKKFYAEWCPSCKLVGPTLIDVLKTKPEFTIVDVDVDKSPEELQRYDIKNIPVMVRLDASGVEVSRFVGNGSESELTAWLNHVPESQNTESCQVD